MRNSFLSPAPNLERLGQAEPYTNWPASLIGKLILSSVSETWWMAWEMTPDIHLPASTHICIDVCTAARKIGMSKHTYTYTQRTKNHCSTTETFFLLYICSFHILGSKLTLRDIFFNMVFLLTMITKYSCSYHCRWQRPSKIRNIKSLSRVLCSLWTFYES